MTKEGKKFQHPSLSVVCHTYKLLHSKGLIEFPITTEAKSKIDSIISNIQSSYFEYEIYKTNEEKAVAYLYFLIKDHPFTDGDKRTASIVFEVICNINELQPNYDDIGLDSFVVFIEKQKPKDHQFFINWISKILFSK